MLRPCEIADPALLLRLKAGATAVIADPEEIAAITELIDTSPRGFTMTWRNLEVTGWKYANELQWKDC